MSDNTPSKKRKADEQSQQDGDVPVRRSQPSRKSKSAAQERMQQTQTAPDPEVQNAEQGSEDMVLDGPENNSRDLETDAPLQNTNDAADQPTEIPDQDMPDAPPQNPNAPAADIALPLTPPEEQDQNTEAHGVLPTTPSREHFPVSMLASDPMNTAGEGMEDLDEERRQERERGGKSAFDGKIVHKHRRGEEMDKEFGKYRFLQCRMVGGRHESWCPGAGEAE